MRRFDDARAPFDHSSGVSEVLAGLDVALEVQSGAGSELSRGWVFDLGVFDTPSFYLLAIEDGRVRTKFVASGFEQLEWDVGLAMPS